MAADIFRERSDNDIRTKRQGRLIERAEKRIIDDERQSAAISGQMLSEHMGCRNIDDAIGRATPRESGLKRPYGRRTNRFRIALDDGRASGIVPFRIHARCHIANSGLPDASFTSSAQVFLTLSTTFCGIGM